MTKLMVGTFHRIQGQRSFDRRIRENRLRWLFVIITCVFIPDDATNMAFTCVPPPAIVIIAGLLCSLSHADIFLHNPRGSNNRLNGAGANRGNNNRLFDSQNNAKGGYNVGDKTDQASTQEDQQFNMHYFQSGKGHTSNQGRSVLTIEWTNQHGCNDRDLNCNFVLQYRCQNDKKHEKLNKHSMRNGHDKATPQYNEQWYASRSEKDQQLTSVSSTLSKGLHESWEWYDKCNKRKRLGVRCANTTKSGKCCVFPFYYEGKEFNSCTTYNNENKLWCGTQTLVSGSSSWDDCLGTSTGPTTIAPTIASKDKANTCSVKTISGICCHFPFLYKNVKYYSCTTDGTPSPGTLWCGTSAQGKSFGICETIKTCSVKTRSGKCCHFPFLYNNVKYYSCTTVDYGTRLWCGTAAQVGPWGICVSSGRKRRSYPGRFRFPLLFGDSTGATGGIFTADQQLQGDTTKYTRQNANGGRSGYECPEERDYYPYWHPTDWTDIAVFAHNDNMCQYYQRESFNVKPKEECLQYYSSKADGFRHDSPISNKAECENNGGFWVSFSNYLEESPQYQTEAACKAGNSTEVPLIWAIPYRSEDIDNLKMVGNDVGSLKRCLVALAPPECRRAPYTRSNHLGNARGVVPARYDWVIPHFPSGNTQRCVLRLRYNISTGDYPPFNTFGDKNNDPVNGVKSPVENNPTVTVGKVQMALKLAINTAQFGRTFQDRSHLFKLVSRRDAASDSDVIYNLNVRGKRGNIVQAYPAVEYDFIPKRLTIPSTSLVHIQWTGSNTNPNGNAGQGTAGTDRSNIVEMVDPSVNHPLTSKQQSTMFTNAKIIWSSHADTKTGDDLATSMASAGYYDSVSRFSTKTTLNNELNNAPASYRGMLLKFPPGEYYYMCTRNNNFSNRNQKGRLTVKA